MSDKMEVYYFSPTGGTKKVTQIFVDAIEKEAKWYDLGKKDTIPEEATSELTVVTAPVFGGRIPSVVREKIKKLKGTGKKAITIVVYGNRAYEDALLEMNDILTENGFTVIASGAFVAQHSMAPEVGAGRPDQEDAKDIRKFAKAILNKKNTDAKSSFDEERRNKIIEAMNSEKYTQVMNKLSRSFMTNLAKGTQTNKFSKEECNKILDIYHKLIENISNYDLDYEKIALEHFTNVRNFISEYTSNLDNKKEEKSTYSPEFILDILNVNADSIKGNILDIGCGKEATLVKYLSEKGLNAHGLDMECEDSNLTEQEDWLLKDYPENEYDLIVSNLAFSKKFNEANMEDNNDQECFEYAAAYMKILNSLKVGGAFHYVPAVTFIEELLPEDKFEVNNSFIDENIMRTVVKKIK